MRTTRLVGGIAALTAAVALAVLPLDGALPRAHAAARVQLDAGGQGAVIDGTYSTKLRVQGAGFQSIKGGHGGVYVWFGTVSGTWRPSQGGRSGVDYVYVPDTESANNNGFQQFVAFPGSATSSSSGAQMSADGTFSVTLTVPGPAFQAVGRNGAVRTIDCRTVTCGVITVGAHGVRNANNETFTPVRVGDLQATGATTGTQSPAQQSAGTATSAQAAVPGSSTTAGAPDAVRPARPAGPVRLQVDRRSAVAGRALAWSATNLVPGRQFSVVLDDGAVASGPHAAGSDGRASSVIMLPADARAGTHELRLFGAGRQATTRFGVVAGVAGGDDTAPAAATEATQGAQDETGPDLAETAGWAFALLGLVAFATAGVVRRRSGRARA